MQKIVESVIGFENLYRIRVIVDINQSMINTYVKKVKEKTGVNLRKYYADIDIADEIAKYIFNKSFNIDDIPVDLLIINRGVFKNDKVEYVNDKNHNDYKKHDEFEEPRVIRSKKNK